MSASKDTQPKSPQLFREQAIAAASAPRYGSILPVTPIAWSKLGFWYLVAGCILIGFAVSCSYARKAAISGVVVPSNGLVRVASSQAGIVAQLSVESGRTVKAGQTMFVVKSDRNTGVRGAVAANLLEALGARRKSLLGDRVDAQQQLDQRIATAQERSNRLAKDIESVVQQIAIQEQRVQLTAAGVTRFLELERSGYAPSLQVQERQLLLLEQKQKLEELTRSREAAERDRKAIDDSVAELRMQARRDRQQSIRDLASLEQELIESEAKAEVAVTAPVAGTVSSVTVHNGQNVLASQVIATIIPSDSVMEVELYAPSASAGLVRAGQSVAVRYRSFAYQKFGQAKGLVREVSLSADRPEELGQQGTEPLYRVRVAVDSQSVKADGATHAIRPGMLVDAMVELESRKLYEWAVAPFLALTNRIN